jgi:hypothetical protein
MTTSPKTFAYGKLAADTDSWLLVREDVIALDVSLLTDFDGSLEHQIVSVIGKMGIPQHPLGLPSSLSKSSQALRQSKGELTKYTSQFSLAQPLSSNCAPNANC